MDAWIQGYNDTGIQGNRDIGIYGSRDTGGMQGYRGIQGYRDPMIQDARYKLYTEIKDNVKQG